MTDTTHPLSLLLFLPDIVTTSWRKPIETEVIYPQALAGVVLVTVLLALHFDAVSYFGFDSGTKYMEKSS